MERPLLTLSLLFAVGCLAGGGVAPRVAVFLIASAAALLLVSLVAPTARSATAALAVAALASGAAAAGVERAEYESASVLRGAAGFGEDPVLLRGVVRGDARDLGGQLRLVLDVDSVRAAGRRLPLAGRVRVDIRGDAGRPDVMDGDRLSVWAALREPRGFANPGSPDTVARARRGGVHLFGQCKSPRLVEVEGPGDVSRLRTWTAACRRWMRARLRAHVPPGPEQGLVLAMALGDRGGLDRETEEDLRAAGTYHVVAISGAQVALLAGLLLWTLRRLGVGPLPTAALVAGGLGFYAQLVGGEPPVARAAVMAIVVVVGGALDLDADLANLLGLAGGLLLLCQPSAVTDVGFQLSFAATLGILLLPQPLLQRLPRLPLRAEVAMAASAAAQVALLTLLAHHFHRVAPAALVLNLAAVPLSGAVLVAGLAVLPASVAPALGDAAGEVAWVAAHALLRSADPLRWLPWLDVRVPTPPLWAVAAHAAALFALADPRRRSRAIVLMGAAAFGVLVRPAHPDGDGRLQLTVLDVGQGDALVVRSPLGRVWVVDAGASDERGLDFGEAVVGPYLWSEGVARIDRLLLTHSHSDHAGGIPFLARTFAVGELWEGPAPRCDAVYDALRRALRPTGLARRTVFRGVATDWDGVEVAVLGPAPPPGPPWITRNDDSVAVAFRFGQVTLLLTGDIEGRGEAGIAPIPGVVLKVPHHGSRTSSTPAFVTAMSPRIAIVSAGFRNRFGHPHTEVIDRYVRLGSLLLRTDRDGAVTVSTDGRRLWSRTQRGGPQASEP